MKYTPYIKNFKGKMEHKYIETQLKTISRLYKINEALDSEDIKKS